MKSPLKILHVTPYSGDAWGYGGIPRLVDTMAREQARRGHSVTVCATDARDAAGRLSAGCHRTADGVEVRLFRNLSNRLAYHAQLFMPVGLDSYLARHAADFQVAHLHACRNLPGAIAARHLHRAGVPYVLAPNGTAPRIERRRFAKRVYDCLIGWHTFHHAARIVAVSAAERRQLHDLGVPSEIVRTIPNPLNVDEFDGVPDRGGFRRRLGIAGGPLVMFLGKLTPRKRVDILVRAFAHARADASLVIAGNDMGSERSVRSLVRDLGLESRTWFTGLLRGRERYEALADADVLVYPSEHEIFGLVPMEALLTGTPVVVSGDSGCGEVVAETGGGLVTPVGDVGALAGAIGAVLENTTMWRQVASAASNRVKSLFGAESVGDRVDRLYGEVVACA